MRTRAVRLEEGRLESPFVQASRLFYSQRLGCYATSYRWVQYRRINGGHQVRFCYAITKNLNAYQRSNSTWSPSVTSDDYHIATEWTPWLDQPGNHAAFLPTEIIRQKDGSFHCSSNAWTY